MKGSCGAKEDACRSRIRQIIGELSTFDHFGESALITATRRQFLRTSGMSGEAKIQTRNATVIAKAEGSEATETMMLTGEGLEKMLQEDNQIDVKALMRLREEEHAQRESLSAARQVWQRSERRKLRDAREACTRIRW